jgi:hypothetical protein
MYIAYYDESGDDGYPDYSSPIFVLSVAYLYYLNWKDLYSTLHEFRAQLKKDYGIPVRWEFHTKRFLLNKNPYRDLGLDNPKRIQVLDLFCALIAQLDLKLINVVINKGLITKPTYDVLNTALKYSIQRIENDLESISPEKKFMVITDPGRLGKMRKTARKIQKFNYIPSKFNPQPYRKEIKLLIEDPLQKDSKESYFIQLVDLVAYVVYVYAMKTLGLDGLSARMPAEIDLAKVTAWMDALRDSFNLRACESDPYGIVWHPK